MTALRIFRPVVLALVSGCVVIVNQPDRAHQKRGRGQLHDQRHHTPVSTAPMPQHQTNRGKPCQYHQVRLRRFADQLAQQNFGGATAAMRWKSSVRFVTSAFIE